MLRDLGIRVQISCCLTRLNHLDVEALYEFAEGVDAEFLRLQPMMPIDDPGKNCDSRHRRSTRH